MVLSHVKEYDRPASLDNPRAPRQRSRGNFEKNAWLFMRFSGIALIVLALAHIFIMLALDPRGIHRIDASFVAQRWSHPYWRIWDIVMLWLAELHGCNGLRVIISDYAHKARTRFWLNFFLLLSAIIIVGVGSYVLLTFDANSFAPTPTVQ